jgi:hypothetical protein
MRSLSYLSSYSPSATGQHLVQDDPQAEDVRALVGPLEIPGLFRRHVAGRPEKLPRARLPRPAGSIDQVLREPEVGHPGHDRPFRGVIEHDVLGLQISVDHAQLVRGADPREHASEQALGLGQRHRPLGQFRAERSAPDEIGHEREPTFVLEDVGHRDHVGVLERRLEGGLFQQAVAETRLVSEEHLQRVQRAELEVARAVDVRDAAAPGEPFDHESVEGVAYGEGAHPSRIPPQSPPPRCSPRRTP